MIYLIGIALLVFWVGVVLLVLSITHIITVSPLFVLFAWLLLLAAVTIAICVVEHKMNKLREENNRIINRADAAAKRKVAEMRNQYPKTVKNQS
jgi:divalent metal cation (Fe/Co/Zn/Cd) transporter